MTVPIHSEFYKPHMYEKHWSKRFSKLPQGTLLQGRGKAETTPGTALPPWMEFFVFFLNLPTTSTVVLGVEGAPHKASRACRHLKINLHFHFCCKNWMSLFCLLLQALEAIILGNSIQR